jgi:hypothetical protein
MDGLGHQAGAGNNQPSLFHRLRRCRNRAPEGMGAYYKAGNLNVGRAGIAQQVPLPDPAGAKPPGYRDGSPAG